MAGSRAPGLLGADFPPVSWEEWVGRVEEELGEASFEEALTTPTLEGVTLRPLYARGGDCDPGGFPGFAPHTRGTGALERGWSVALELAGADPEAAGAALSGGIEAGAELVWLRLDRAGRGGHDASDSRARRLVGRGGVAAATADDLATVLAGADLERLCVHLEPGANALPAAALLVAAAVRRGVPPASLRGGFGCDPLGALATDGELPGPVGEAFVHAAELALWCRREAPGMRALLVSSEPYHEAGAGADLELACAVASGLEALRRLADAGLDADDVSAQLVFAFSVTGEVFLEVAKLRAARLLWSRVARAAGGSGCRVHLHARTSGRLRTRRDPWGNLLRGTAGGFAAAVGGARSIAVAPFDATLGVPAAWSRRIALGTQHVLREEAHLGRVIDPAGGSHAVEELTRELARAAWEEVREIERRGGMAQALADGWLVERAAQTAERRLEDASAGRTPIVGVSEFADPDEEPLERPAADPAAAAAASARRLDERITNPTSKLGVLADARGAERVDAAVAAVEAGAALGEVSEALWTLPPWSRERPAAPVMLRCRPPSLFEDAPEEKRS